MVKRSNKKFKGMLMLWLMLLVESSRGNLLPGDPGGGHHHHQHHHDEQHPHHHHEAERQGRAEEGEGQGPPDVLIDFANAVDDPDTGLRCVFENKTIQTLEKERLLECTHSLINVCHYTYITAFKPNREEECTDHYEKICNINFVPKATQETIEHCYKPMLKECNDINTGSDDLEICKTVYETECSTRYEEKKSDSSGVTKFVGNTQCNKLPVELCGSPSCQFVEGPQQCHNKTSASIISVPEESCDLVPQTTCKGVFKLAPFLKPVHQCKDVPREICTFGVLSSSIGEGPLATKWCYDPQQGDLLTQALSEGTETTPRPTATTPRPKIFPSTPLPPLEEGDLAQYAPLAPPDNNPFLPPPPFLPAAGVLVATEGPDAAPLADEVDYPEDYESPSYEDFEVPTYDYESPAYEGSPQDLAASRPEASSLAASKPGASNLYLPPAQEIGEDRRGRKIKPSKISFKEEADKTDEAAELLEDLLESALETVKKDPEAAVRFGQRIEDNDIDSNNIDSRNNNFDDIEDILPDVFQFPNQVSRSPAERPQWKLPREGKNDEGGEKGRSPQDGGRGQDRVPKEGDQDQGEIEFFDHKRFPQEFKNIFGAIEAGTKSKVKLAKVGPGVQVEGHRPIAHVIKHNNQDNGIARTVVIQNIPEAHQAFGIKNIPAGFFEDMKKVIKSGARPLSAKPVIKPFRPKQQQQQPQQQTQQQETERFEEDVRTDAPDLTFSGETKTSSGVRTVIIKNTARDFEKFGVTNVPEGLIHHLREQPRESKSIGAGGVDSESGIPDSYVTDQGGNAVFFGSRPTKSDTHAAGRGENTGPSAHAGPEHPATYWEPDNSLQFKSENNFAPPPGFFTVEAEGPNIKSTLESQLVGSDGGDPSSSISGSVAQGPISSQSSHQSNQQYTQQSESADQPSISTNVANPDKQSGQKSLQLILQDTQQQEYGSPVSQTNFDQQENGSPVSQTNPSSQSFSSSQDFGSSTNLGDPLQQDFSLPQTIGSNPGEPLSNTIDSYTGQISQSTGQTSSYSSVGQTTSQPSGQTSSSYSSSAFQSSGQSSIQPSQAIEHSNSLPQSSFSTQSGFSSQPTVSANPSNSYSSPSQPSNPSQNSFSSPSQNSFSSPSQPSENSYSSPPQSSNPSQNSFSPPSQPSTPSQNSYSSPSQTSQNSYSSPSQSSNLSQNSNSSPSQSSNPSQNSYSSPSQSSNPPQNSYSSPSQSSNPSQNSYSNPSQSSNPSQNSYSSPSQSSNPSQNSYSSPSQSSNPSQNSYSSPSQSSNPSQNSYSSPSQSSNPSQNSYSSPSQSSNPSQNSYSSPSQSSNPSQNSYSSPSQSSKPSQSSFSSPTRPLSSSSYSSAPQSGSPARPSFQGSGSSGFYRQPSQSQYNLKPVPEVVRPSQPGPRPRRPPTVVRNPAVTAAQQFAKPSQAAGPAGWQSAINSQKAIYTRRPTGNGHNTNGHNNQPNNIGDILHTGGKDNRNIFTNRPMTFQTASGNFIPPATLMYGFKPMTDSLPENLSTKPPADYGGSSQFQPPPKLNYGFKPAAEQTKDSYQTRFKKSRQSTPQRSKETGSTKEAYSIINQISEFLEPFTSFFK